MHKKYVNTITIPLPFLLILYQGQYLIVCLAIFIKLDKPEVLKQFSQLHLKKLLSTEAIKTGTNGGRILSFSSIK